MCRKSIANLIQRFINPNGTPQAGGDTPGGGAGGRSPMQVIVPAHLQDLKEGDLPENQRVMVLDQIAGFRESSMRFDREKKRQEEEKERYKSMGGSSQPYQPGPSDYGYGNRALSHNHQQQHQREQQQQQQQQQRSRPGQQTPHNGPQASGSGGQGSHAARERDPQGYSDPVNFVRAKEAQSKVESDRTDEEEEQLRQQFRDRERDAALREVRHTRLP